MATYVIGDVQGCFYTLRHLLKKIAFDAQHDELWFTGDLVNRGRHSRPVLELVAQLGERAKTVLGNHDVHLLRLMAGLVTEKPRDTLRELLDGRDAEQWCRWLRQQPLCVDGGDVFMVHGGILPGWDKAEAMRQATAIAQQLRDEHGWRQVLDRQKSPLGLRVLTTIRTCDSHWQLGDFSGALADVPSGYYAWFRHPAYQPWPGTRILFGHWSAIGVYEGEGVIGLDSGVVWGRALSAWRREDGKIVSVPTDHRDIDPQAMMDDA